MAGRAVTPTGIHAFLPFYIFFGDDFGYLDLGTFAGGTTSEARGINDLGQVVGFSDTGDGTRRAFGWTSGPLTGLGTLGGSSCATCESLAYAINNSGQIVGESDALLPLFKLAARHAFLIPTTSEIVLESLHDVGTLGGTLCFTCRSAAYDINESGHIVGESEIVLASSFTHAFLYRDGVMQDLNDLLPDTARALWVLTDARGINDLGQVVGTGLFEGRMRAYLLTPPAQLLVTNVQELLPILNFESPGLRESLEMKLRAAHQALRQNQQLAACNQVAAFDYEVRAQSGRGLPVVQADKLTAGADLIKTELVCQP